METPLVSVIYPAFNDFPEHIKESMDSLINQDYPNLEIIVIDDSPEVKRRRVVHDDMPHIVRQSEFPVSSSVHTRKFIPQPRQRIPVYDAAPSEDAFFVQTSRATSRRYEKDDTRVPEFEPAGSMMAPGSYTDRQRGFPEPLRYAGNSTINRPVAGSEDLHAEYPESRVLPSSSRGRDDLISFPGITRGGPFIHGTVRSQPEDHPDRSFITLRRAQDLSPRPVERPR